MTQTQTYIAEPIIRGENRFSLELIEDGRKECTFIDYPTLETALKGARAIQKAKNKVVVLGIILWDSTLREPYKQWTMMPDGEIVQLPPFTLTRH